MKLINLLPKNKQRELHYEVMLHSLWVLVWATAFSFILVLMAQFGTKFYLQIEAGVYKAEIADLQGQVSKQENADIKKKIKAVNDTVSDFQNLANSSPKWSKVIKAFVVLPPPGTKINTFVVEPVKKTITINGLSSSRETVIQLYNNILKDSAEFYNVDYPLENVAKPNNSPFHFTFSIQDSLLK
ncbi:MAG: hypothetical protein HY918_00970 [Candidatus Doudnabacteria bacterium]|nr:hypothetical protein [Candidatus Doudnabacteria bacterium]